MICASCDLDYIFTSDILIEMKRTIPQWIKKKVRVNKNYYYVKSLLKELGLHTVCESAFCPNIYECFSKKYATFMILGNTCTRNCKFCGVNSGKPEPVDEKEPEKIAAGVKKLSLKYAVITSVTRDDLPDGGANHFAEVTRKIKELNAGKTKIELLIPDFHGEKRNLNIVFESNPDVISHNIETVLSLYSSVRPEASYSISLKVLDEIKKAGFPSKSSFMLGLGENKKEVIKMMEDLRKVNCEFLVIGQYLQPSKNAFPVKEYIKPEIFEEYKEIGEKMGFKRVFAGTFFRSSYMAEELIQPY